MKQALIQHAFLAAFTAGCLVACGPDGLKDPADAAQDDVTDAAARDAGHQTQDAGTGVTDAASTDAAAADAGPGDGGVPDSAVSLDAAVGTDAGPTDGAVGDAAAVDASPDAGRADAGMPGDCPANVTCVVAPHEANGTTVDGTDLFDFYNCAPSLNESGPERIYRVTLPGAGILSVTLDSDLETGGVDVDVHILSSLSANACLARGHLAAAASVTGTTAFVVLDSYTRSNGTDGRGAFHVTISFQEPGANPLLSAGVPATVAQLAFTAYQHAMTQNLSNSAVYSVIDFSQPSTQQRLWVVDMETGQLLLQDRVSHGSGSNSPSDPAMASTFSNMEGSHQSSLGLALTAETYEGSNGYSLRLDGLEDANSNMRARAIVVHGASYAEDSFVEANGYLGRSNGCPAVALSRAAATIDLIKNGTLMFSYFPQEEWLNNSPFLR